MQKHDILNNQDSQQSKYLKERKKKEEYLKEYKKYEKEHAMKLDKYILLTPPVLFNLIFIFIDKVVPFQTAQVQWLLSCSLIAITLAVASTLISFKVATDEGGNYIKGVQDSIQNNTDCGESVHKVITWRTAWIPRLNYCSLVLIIISVTSLTIFIIYNLHYMKN